MCLTKKDLKTIFVCCVRWKGPRYKLRLLEFTKTTHDNRIRVPLGDSPLGHIWWHHYQ